MTIELTSKESKVLGKALKMLRKYDSVRYDDTLEKWKHDNQIGFDSICEVYEARLDELTEEVTTIDRLLKTLLAGAI